MHIDIQRREQTPDRDDDATPRRTPAWIEELLFEVIPIYRDVRVGAKHTQAAAPRVLDN